RLVMRTDQPAASSKWVPTHVNVTVLRARGLRTKGKHGGSRYVYTIIQVGKEKYTTGLVEKATVPEWNEECCFELLPGILEDGVRSAFPSGSGDLVLTIMHRVLIGLDVFLGQAILPLDKIFQDGIWLKLNSKAGRKEKERGEIQVTVQFTRNNLTASMFDLTMKDKPRSAFGKLKDRVTGRKIGDMESSSAIVPGRFATLSGSLGNKVKDFFKGKGKLRSSSDTRSCSSLASESTSLCSLRNCFGREVIVKADPFQANTLTPFFSPQIVLNNTQSSPKILTHNRTLSDEASRITTTAVPQPCPAVESLKGQGMTPSQSSLCINGSHIYGSEPVGPKGSGTLPSKLVLLEKCSPLSRSLQNLTKQNEDNGSAGEGRRWSFDKVNKEDEYVEKEAVPHVSQVQSAQVGGRPVLAAASMLSSNTTVDSADKRKKLRKSLFSGGKSDSLPAKLAPSQGCPLTEGRLRGCPHPVKPLTTTASQGEKKEGRSFLEKLKSSIHSGLAGLCVSSQESLTDRSAQYEQLTKMELISLLLQQQMDMENQKVRDLEDYIDRLLVQIMEQTPTLLQVRSRHK
uniref:RAB11 family interacting protein 5b (class I) n=1 Tax=Oncorhynchus mykiss TaxID=8022 RepID=A0A8C7VYJ7_ONCMY